LLGVIVTVGFGKIVTGTVAVLLQLNASNPFTVYTPAASNVFLKLGFCWVDVKLFGPVQLYVVAPLAVKLSVALSHTGELLATITTGKSLMVTVVTLEAILQFVLPILPASATNKRY
jgi:hypothetical protein